MPQTEAMTHTVTCSEFGTNGSPADRFSLIEGRGPTHRGKPGGGGAGPGGGPGGSGEPGQPGTTAGRHPESQCWLVFGPHTAALPRHPQHCLGATWWFHVNIVSFALVAAASHASNEPVPPGSCLQPSKLPGHTPETTRHSAAGEAAAAAAVMNTRSAAIAGLHR